MKIKYLLIISLILAIITIGAVSASENITDDDLAQTVSDEEILEEPHEEVLSAESQNDTLQATESNEVLGDYYSGKVHIEVKDTVDLSSSYYDLGSVSDDNGIKGTITVSIDGKKVYSKKFTGKYTYYYFDRKDINLKKYSYGYHNVKITYNDGKAKSDSRKVNFVYTPRISNPLVMAVGETSYISIKGAAGMSGSATLYARDVVGYDKYNESIYKKGAALKTIKIKDGQALIPLTIVKDGDQSFLLDYKIGTYDGLKIFYVEVSNNTPGYKSSISAKSIYEGKSVTLRLTGPKTNIYATIYVDGKYLKDVKFSSGSLKEVISGLSRGTHFITIGLYQYNSKIFHSNTFKVTVKSNVQLALKKVVVKKSAKKLILKATLKINKKLAKAKKVTFKFNGKKYVAKTNKKGVVKVTIKKDVLKKLKVGKNVTYQVTYGKDTKKVTVKVKK